MRTSFSLATFWLGHSYKKFARLTLMKLTAGVALFASISLNSNSFVLIVTRSLDSSGQSFKLGVATQVTIGCGFGSSS